MGCETRDIVALVWEGHGICRCGLGSMRRGRCELEAWRVVTGVWEARKIFAVAREAKE